MARFDPILGARRAPLWCSLALFVALAGATVFVNQAFLPSGAWRPLWSASGGWVHPTLLAGLGVLAVAFTISCLAGPLKLSDLGLGARRIPIGLFYGAAVWGAAQVLITGWGVVLEGRPRFDSSWSTPGVTGGAVIAQLFGNALMEETIYRGFFFTQWVLWVRGEARVASLRHVFIAASLAAILFALSHVPNRVWVEGYAGFARFAKDQGMLVLAGFALALVYWRTRNLPFVIVFHALINRPSMAFEVPDAVPLPPRAAVIAFGAATTLLWPRLPWNGELVK